MQETWVQSLGWYDSLEKGKAIHSSILVWSIQSMGSQRVGHHWVTFMFTFKCDVHFIVQSKRNGSTLGCLGLPSSRICSTLPISLSSSFLFHSTMGENSVTAPRWSCISEANYLQTGLCLSDYANSKAGGSWAVHKSMWSSKIQDHREQCRWFGLQSVCLSKAFIKSHL